MNIIIENHYGKTYRVEGVDDDITFEDFKEQFVNLCVAMGYSPSIKDDAYGHYEYVLNEPENEEGSDE